MKLTKTKREAIAKAYKVTSIIQEKLREKDAQVKDSVDLSRIASDLADRRNKVLKLNEE